MDSDELDTRAGLHLVIQKAADLHRTLDALTPDATARIGLTAEDLDRIALLTSRSLWASTADLNQVGRVEDAERVILRATELEEP